MTACCGRIAATRCCYEDNYNFLSKMCLGAMRQAACGMIAAARHAGARIIAAGPDVTDAPAPY